ncbi:MAG: hypothetical protein J3Q66DRAFT_359967 [Benniella sp.]|nr:MAG: hypothetical protein J3Q66DRAFT_359967 [Benniella sp.]
MQRKYPRLRKSLLANISCILLFILLNIPAHAQNYQPFLTVQAGNAFVEGKALYVLSGGTVGGTIAEQAFMIDLSVPWNTSSPAYKRIPLGPLANWFPSAMSADGQKLFALARGEAFVFDIPSSNWSQIFSYPAADEIAGCAATDPGTGKIFIPFAYKLPSGTSRAMMIVDLKTNSYTSDNSTFPVPNQSIYAATWNAQLRSLLYSSYGAMYTYNPSDRWKSFNPPPGLRASHSYCMVSSSSGSIVVLFGGFSTDLNASVGDIFILDARTLVWKKGASTQSGDVRRSPACAVSNGYFIAWGGDQGNTRSIVPSDHLIVVYNLKTDKWTSGYMETNPTDSETPSNADSKEASGASGSIGLILGVVGGAIVIGLILGGIIENRVRKSRSKSSSSPVPTNVAYVDAKPNNDKDPEEGIEATNKGKRTVQEGAFGSESESQNPHSCTIGSESATQYSHSLQSQSMPRHPHKLFVSGQDK